MKLIPLIACAILLITRSFAQPPAAYFEEVKKADSLYKIGQYKAATDHYMEGFKANNWKAFLDDRYGAAWAWTKIGMKDSAFYQLNRIATRFFYTNLDYLKADTVFIPLHDDSRWNEILDFVTTNKTTKEKDYNWPLIAQLKTIHENDQKYRHQIDSIETKFGANSKEVKNLWKVINEHDSLNLIQVKKILDEHGWLGPDIVSDLGNSTLFLVIQHADLKTQVHYLPMMQEAVKNKKAYGQSLALLEDRVALGLGKKQVYGSQIGRNPVTEVFYVLPLEDPEHVDEKRASVGLGPLADYVSNWDIVWNVQQYIKDLPEIEKLQEKK